MQQPLQITFKDIDHSDAVETHIRDQVEKLEHFYNDIISCHVVIEFASKNQNQGKLHNIHINLGVPGNDLAVTRNASENLYISIRDAFEDMRIKLQTYKDMIKGHTKSHSPVMHGKVMRIFDHDEFGFIEGPNGDEYYFNSGNVTNSDFNKLEVGHEVSFIEAIGGDGLQAHRVSVKKSVNS